MGGTHLCHSGATCVNTDGSYACSCKAGWKEDGLGCIDLDDCTPNPCENGGKCNDIGGNSYVCSCIEGWCEKNCDENCNECADGSSHCDRWPTAWTLTAATNALAAPVF